MKILMTADCIGGVWTYAIELARGLKSHRVEILLVSSGGPLSDSQRREVQSLSNVRFVETRFKLEWMPDPWKGVVTCGERLRELAAEFRPDVVHLNEFSHGAHDWPAPTLVVGHSCVWSWYENVRGTPPGAEWRRYRREVTRGLLGASLVVAPTRFMLDSLERHYGALRSKRVIHNGYTPPATRYKTAREPFVFAAGRWWDEAKNVAALGSAASRLAWPVKIAGLPSPEGATTNLPGNIESLGRLDSAAMRRCYRRAPIYCLPARYEPFGLTPLEAATHGCALVLGDIPSLREVWGDAAAFVPPDDTNALARQLNRLIADRAARHKLAERCQARAAQFSRARMATAYLDAYRTLTGASVTARSDSIVRGAR